MGSLSRRRMSRRGFINLTIQSGLTLAALFFLARDRSLIKKISSIPQQPRQGDSRHELAQFGVNCWNLCKYPLYKIEQALDFIDSLYATTVRVFIDDSLEPYAPGFYNDKILKKLDYIVYRTNDRGYRFKFVVALFDCFTLQHMHGSFGTLLRDFSSPYYWASSAEAPQARIADFYTNNRIKDLFKERLRHILCHENVYTGVPYNKERAILAFEIANEPEVPHLLPFVYNNQALYDWLEDTSGFIKSLAPEKYVLPGVRHVIGPFGIDPFQFLSIPSLDGTTFHLYPSTTDALENVLLRAAWAEKPVVIEEFGFMQDKQYKLPQFLNRFSGRPVNIGAMLWGVGLEGYVTDYHHIIPSDEISVGIVSDAYKRLNKA